MPKVIAIFPGRSRPLGGCEIYRTTLPFSYMNKKYPNWKMSWAFIEDILNMSYFKGQSVIRSIVKDFDLFVLPRLQFKDEASIYWFQDFTESINALGKKVVYEVDDDMTNEHRQVIDGDAISAASYCNAITVTTPYLANLMTVKTGRKSYIIPNMFGPDIWHSLFTGTFRYSDKITIGLTGSPTHYGDWKVLETVLPEIMRQDNVHLILMGFHPDYLSYLPNTSYIPGVEYGKYAQVIQTCDIVLAPLSQDDAFNLSKSPIKCIEGMAARRILGGVPAGAACIASNHPVYQLAITNERNGLLVDHTPQGWLDGLQELIKHETLRNKFQVAGHEWVNKHHNIKTRVSLWRDAYNAVLHS